MTGTRSVALGADQGSSADQIEALQQNVKESIADATQGAAVAIAQHLGDAGN